MKNKKQTNLDYQDPGNLPSELMDVPGFVNELKAHTMAVAARPNETVAFAGALAMLAHLSGRTYRDSRGCHTNLYIAALAPSGMGKEVPRDVNKRLAAEVGILDSLADSFASGEALEDALYESPSLLLQSDEADTFLTALRGIEGRSGRLSEMTLRFFGEADGVHALRQKAGENSIRVIVQPHLNVFATGIPKFFYSAFNEKALTNGLLGRFLIIDTTAFQPLGEMTPQPFSKTLVETARAFVERERAICESESILPIVVPDTPEAALRVKELKAANDAVTERLMITGHECASALYARLPEKALKLALIRALSARPDVPRVTADDVTWGTMVASHLTRRMLYLAQFYVAEGKFDRLKKRTLALLEQAGGEMDGSTLLRKLSVDADTFHKIMRTLQLCGLTEEKTLPRGKKIYRLVAE